MIRKGPDKTRFVVSRPSLMGFTLHEPGGWKLPEAEK